MYFVRIYEEYGFLVQMVILTIQDLTSFLHALLLSIFFFALCFSVLEIDTDDDIKDVKGPGFNKFGLIFLQTYRIVMGEIGVPAYEDLENRQKHWIALQSQIFLIWCTWFICTFSMIIILLNFLIAVITETYEEVATKQSIYTYVHKASLNEEIYHIISFFFRMKPYKAVVFSFNKELAVSGNNSGEEVSGGTGDSSFQYVVSRLKNLIKKETKEIKQQQNEMMEYI